MSLSNGALVELRWVANSRGLRTWLGKSRITVWRPTVSTEIKGHIYRIAYRFFSVMPPSFPHAVFTPEDCLAVGGQIYVAANLGRSIEGLKLQEDHPDISNEDLHHSVYRTLGWVLRGCDAVTTSVERAQRSSAVVLCSPSFRLLQHTTNVRRPAL